MEISCFHSSVLLVHFFILSISRLHSLTISTDQSALLALKARIDPETQNILASNWTTATSVCNWTGVSCGGQPQRVIALNLSSMGLKGTIPPHIGNLSSLTLLSLSSNNFTGAIPTELGNLTMLNMLCLGHNNLDGAIPWEIGYLTNVKILSISHNHLTGQIPRSIGNCTSLVEINLSENNFTGALPPEIGNLSNLEALRVNDNILRGNIPSTIFNISTLQVVWLYQNHLSGNLPPMLGFFLPNLVELHLQGNELQGTIPNSISNASKLTLLDLSDNKFTGIIPNSIGNLRNLQRLELAHNHLTSESSMVESNFISSLTENRHLRRIVLSGNPLNSILPTSIGNLSTFLEYFLVTDCNLKGIIPAEIGNLSSLIALEMGTNGLTGVIPNTIGTLQNLQGLHLQNNRLNGTILYDLCKLSSLVELFLGGNELSGSIPECSGNLTALRNISLGFNRLTSTIPSSLWSLEYILSINMSSNSLQGSLPLEIENLRVVTEIDLSKNQLSGYIPNSIGNLKDLMHLSLAENKLEGSIPESFSGSVSIEFLDLSCNNLSGVIPKSLVKLLYLKYFNVSSNELQGEIPSGGPFANFTAQSYVMNKALCGAAQLQVSPCKTGTSEGTQRTLFILLKFFLPVIASYYMLLLIHVLIKQYCQKTMIPPLPTKRTILYLEIALATDAFSENNLLGTGGFGSVYKGTMKEEKNVAIKVFNMHTEKALRSFQDESKLLSSTDHPNIVKLINSCCDDDFKALVLEYMPNGSLDKWLYTHNYFLNLLQRLDIMIEVASAMVYLHARYIVHCDLKPSNVLLDDGMIAHVSDFSIAKLLDCQDSPVQTSNLATVGYMAPEYGSRGIISEKTDVYSFGILLMETFTRKKPTDEMFDGEMNLRRWVFESYSLPHGVDRITDVTLLESCPEDLAAKRKCILSIMEVAMFCTAELSLERKTMGEVEKALQRIKKDYLGDTEWLDQRIIYPRISHQELLLATDGFNENKIVQFGESSAIYKGKLLFHLHKETAAIKIFDRTRRGRESFAVESEVLAFICHRNVVRILMMCKDVGFKALVLEYMPNGSLEEWLNYIDGDISFWIILTKLNKMIDVASALCYLHTMHVIHCNLKPSNVLLDKEMVARVSDFSIAKCLGKRNAATKTMTMATSGYMAPEYESTGTVSEKTDVYSFGILLMETFTRKKPTDEMFNEEMNFRHWICFSLPHAVDSIVDFTLLQSCKNDLAALKTCILSIMEVACCCTAEFSDERMTMTEVETKLKRIRKEFQVRVPTKRTILYSEITLATDGFSESNLLDSGVFGSVYKGTMKEKNVAIKVFNMNIRALRSFQDESKILSSTDHPNIVKLINSCCDDDFRALVLEYMPNGTLDEWLYTHNYFLNLLQRLDIMIEVASAMVHLHARYIIHCDLKPSKVLLDDGMIAHVSDFSIAKLLDWQDSAVQTSTKATVGYMAPEYGSSGIISEKTDVYSFGILLMETFTGKKPTDEMFDGKMNLRRWVFESLHHGIDRITDVTLLESGQEALTAKRKCILSIMRVARFCTAELSVERMTMREVEKELQGIKRDYLGDTELLDEREMYPSIACQELLLATDGFSTSKIIQFGESSVMYKGKRLLWYEDVAIKVFNRIESFAVESKVLSFIRHRNVVRIWMMCNDVDVKALVLEYMPNGSLEEWLNCIDGDISFRIILTKLNKMIDVASALCYLHSMRVIHCNLKPSNVLLDKEMVAHVSDFSIAKRLGEETAATKTTTMATAGYMAPEYESAGSVSEKTDVYSFGILLIETFTRKKPTDEMFKGELNLRHWICSSLPHALDSIVHFTSLQSYKNDLAALKTSVLSIMEVASCCIAESSNERMTMTEVETKLVRIKEKFPGGFCPKQGAEDCFCDSSHDKTCCSSVILFIIFILLFL